MLTHAGNRVNSELVKTLSTASQVAEIAVDSPTFTISWHPSRSFCLLCFDLWHLHLCFTFFSSMQIFSFMQVLAGIRMRRQRQVRSWTRPGKLKSVGLPFGIDLAFCVREWSLFLKMRSVFESDLSFWKWSQLVNNWCNSLCVLQFALTFREAIINTAFNGKKV